MTNQSILFDAGESVSIVTLNRPEVYNAIRRDELEELSRIIEVLEGDRPRVVILTASSPGFCSGIDLKESREATEGFARERCTLMHDVLHRLRNLPVPVITAIDGVAAGLGCELAISGDLRIASPDSRLSYPEPKVAVPSPTFHLNQLIGLARTGHAPDCTLDRRGRGASLGIDHPNRKGPDDGSARQLADEPHDLRQSPGGEQRKTSTSE
ncbi:MAG: enoyl-CoA hydratase/isomerase family protein [Thermomicrobiales bacterium]